MTREIYELIYLANRHGYPVRVVVDGVAYDGWIWGSETPSSVVVCSGALRYTFEWSELEDATFLTTLAERMTGSWILENVA